MVVESGEWWLWMVVSGGWWRVVDGGEWWMVVSGGGEG